MTLAMTYAYPGGFQALEGSMKSGGSQATLCQASNRILIQRPYHLLCLVEKNPFPCNTPPMPRVGYYPAAFLGKIPFLSDRPFVGLPESVKSQLK